MRKLAKIVAIAAFISSGVAHSATPEWKLSESNGTVNILRSGVSKIALSGGSLRAGDVISTGKKGRAVLVRGQEYVVVSPNSRLRISEPKSSGGIVQFFEEIGNAIFRIDKKATPHFGVNTPYLAAVVKGTTFSVTVTESGSAVQVTEGAVQVSTLDGGATQLLSPGMIGMVKNSDQFRLSISGEKTATIVSPNAPNGESDGETAPFGTEIASGSFEGVISAPVVENPVSLSELTGGLVSNGQSGGATTQFAMNDVSLPVDLGLSNGGSNNNPGTFGQGNNGVGDNGNNGNGNGNGGSNGGGNGNGNNGNGNGNGGSNGGGNGNGNNGNGNGNGGSNGGGNGNGNNGNGNGNGGSNSGGNGNGNNVNGNGNGGSNGGGNGNGNNGNGNGNGGSNGGGKG